MNKIVKYPFGYADVVSVPFASAIEAKVQNMETVLSVGQMSGDATINVDVHPEVDPGAVLTVKVSADATNRVLTLGSGLSGNAYTVNANKTAVLSFKFDGSTFLNTGVILIN